MDRKNAVYILTNQHHTVLYVGVTNNLKRRMREHRAGKGSVFTSRYRIRKLVYYELTDDIRVAIEREKQLKAGPRWKKEALIDNFNPYWKDLFYRI